MTTGNINLLMTGGGAPGAAGILRCLSLHHSIRITVADANPNALGQYLQPKPHFETIPMASDPGFIDAVAKLCRERNINLLMPLVTRELIPLARHREQFEQSGTRIMVSPAASLEIANNKGRLYEFLQWRGLAVPGFRIVETVDQFIEAVKELGYPQKPVCIKPSVSNGSRGFRILSETINEADLLFNHKPSQVYARLQDIERILANGPFPELLVSEYLPGDEYSVDCLANEGELILALPRLRKKMINGISVEGEFVNNESIIAYCKSVTRDLRLHGNIGIQMKATADGGFGILEINPRVQGTISAALGAGINMPLLAVKQELGLPVSPEELTAKWGTRFSRYWNEVFY